MQGFEAVEGIFDCNMDLAAAYEGGGHTADMEVCTPSTADLGT